MHEYNIQSVSFLLKHSVVCNNRLSAFTGSFQNFFCDPDAVGFAHLNLIFGL